MTLDNIVNHLTHRATPESIGTQLNTSSLTSVHFQRPVSSIIDINTTDLTTGTLKSSKQHSTCIDSLLANMQCSMLALVRRVRRVM
jgi:hypothetical protein